MRGIKNWNDGFTAGFWYAVQQHYIYGNQQEAEFLIQESGISEAELRQSQKESGYENEQMTQLLDKFFNQ